MIVEKGYKLEKIVAKDSVRPHLCNPWLDTENEALVAADGFCLAAVQVELDEDDTSGPIPVDALKAARKGPKSLDKYILCGEEEVRLPTHGQTHKRYEVEGTKFPDWQEVMDRNDPEWLQDPATATFDAKRFWNLVQAVCDNRPPSSRYHVRLYVHPTDPEQPVAVQQTGNGRARGLLMPVYPTPEVDRVEGKGQIGWAGTLEALADQIRRNEGGHGVTISGQLLEDLKQILRIQEDDAGEIEDE